MEKISVEFFIEKEFVSKLYKNIREQKISLPLYLINLLKSDLESIIKLEDGFIFDMNNSELFTSENKLVHLSGTEKELFKLLLKKNGDIVSFEEIKNKVWKKRDISLHTLRNMINKLRKKTSFTMIITIPKQGYKINLISYKNVV